jgi:hypothetical protein
MIRLCPKRSAAPQRHHVNPTPDTARPRGCWSLARDHPVWAMPPAGFPMSHGTGRSRLGARADRRAREVWGERILQPQWRRRGRCGQHGERPATGRTRQRRPQGQLDRGRRDRDPGPGGGRDRREPGCPPACVAGRRGSWRTCTTSNRYLSPTGGCPLFKPNGGMPSACQLRTVGGTRSGLRCGACPA